MLRRLTELALLSLALFAVLELSARVHLFGVAGLIPERINSIRALPQTGFTVPSPEPGLPFELAPNLDAWFKLVPFRTNAQGMRDDEYALAKPAGTVRVAVGGASYALPAGVALEDAFHSRLERRWSEAFAPTRYELLNHAVGMYNPEHVLTMLERRALAYQPDLLLFAVTRLSMPWLARDPASEAGRALRRLDPEKLPSFERSYPMLQSFALRLVLLRTGAAVADGRPYVGTLERLFMRITNRPPAAPEAGTRRPPRPAAPVRGSVIERLAALAAREGVPVALIRLEYEDVEPEPIDREVAQAASRHGVPYLDTREAFRGTRARDFWIYALDPHPNAAAHARFAERIDAFVRERGLLPGASP